MRPDSSQTGFTIIELMIAIAIVAVMAALAVPAFNDFFEKSRLRGAADDMISFLNAQRLASVKSDRQVHVSVRGADNAWCLGARSAAVPTAGQQVQAAPECNCSSAAAQCQVDGQQATLSSADFGGSSTRPTIDSADILFAYDGRLGAVVDADGTFAAGGDVVLASSSGRWSLRVEVLALGQPRVCVPGGSLPMSGYQTC